MNTSISWGMGTALNSSSALIRRSRRRWEAQARRQVYRERAAAEERAAPRTQDLRCLRVRLCQARLLREYKLLATIWRSRILPLPLRPGISAFQAQIGRRNAWPNH